jgi:hypothetical protein
MSAPIEVLRNYLLQLGFNVNTTESKKFENTLTGIGVKANLLSSAIKQVGSTVMDMAENYARAMEKLYFQSQHLGTPIATLKAFGYAGKQSGKDVTEAISNIRDAMQNVPGQVAIGRVVGRPVSGDEDPSQLALEFLQKLKDFNGGAQDPVTKQMREQLANDVGFHDFADWARVLPKVIEDMQWYIDSVKKSGANMDEVGKTANKLGHAFRKLEAAADILTDAFVTKLAGPLNAVADWMERNIKVPGTNKPFSWADPLNSKDEQKRILDKAYDWLRFKIVDAATRGHARDRGINPPDMAGVLENGGGSAKTPSPTTTAPPRGDLINGPERKAMGGAMQFSQYEQMRQDAQQAEDIQEIQRELDKLGRIKDPAIRARNLAILEEQLDMAQSYTGPRYADFKKFEAEREAKSPGTVAITQSNTFNIQGGDTKAVVQGVGSAIDKSNGNLVSNFGAGMQ